MDERMTIHTHNGVDSAQINGRDLENSYRDAIADVTGTASGTYTATEQGLINSLTTKLNLVLDTLRKVNIIKE